MRPLSQDVNPLECVSLAFYILICVWHLPMLCTVTRIQCGAWKRPVNSVSITMFISPPHSFWSVQINMSRSLNAEKQHQPLPEIQQFPRDAPYFLPLPVSSSHSALLAGVCVCVCVCMCAWGGVWTSAFVATSVRAVRLCRQGRSPETDAPGVCSSLPPLSTHTHPSGSNPLALLFITQLLLSEQGAH